MPATEDTSMGALAAKSATERISPLGCTKTQSAVTTA
jgi:hypothetical protein